MRPGGRPRPPDGLPAVPDSRSTALRPAYRPTLVDPYREHLRRRRAEDPAVPVTHLLEEIRELGYTGSANLPVRYLNQSRAEGDRPVTTPRHAGRLLLTDPENLRPKETTLWEKIAAACPEMTALADLVRGFAALLKPAEGHDVKPTEWTRPPGPSTGPPSTPASPCPTATAAPKASTPAPRGS